MSPEFARKWADALRSGRYAQATGTLRNPDGFCCLGVACDLIDPEAWKADNRYLAFTFRGLALKFIPLPVRRAIGISDAEVDVLIQMNDGMKKSFVEIAGEVERMGGLA